jgi:hypothetical protein
MTDRSTEGHAPRWSTPALASNEFPDVTLHNPRADRRVDPSHYDRDAVSNVAWIDLDDIPAHVAGGGEPGTVVKDAAIA